MSRPKKDPEIEPLYAELGKRVLRERQRLGISQDALGKKVGLTRTSITNLERGKQRLMVDKLVLIASELSVPVSELLPTPAKVGTLAEAVDGITDRKEKEFVMNVLKLDKGKQ